MEDLANRIPTDQFGHGWNFYGHLDDPAQGQPNFNHPIHIRQPMIEFFRGASTLEEQLQRFEIRASWLVNAILELESFDAFRQALKPESAKQ